MSRPSDAAKLAVWRQRFERFSNSGLTVARFCDREGVSVASFYRWRKKLGPQGRRRPATDRHRRLRTGLAAGRGVFQQVAVVPAASGVVRGAPAVCIQLPCGTRIEVGADDLDALRTVVGEVVGADRGWEVARADCRRQGGVVSC